MKQFLLFSFSLSYFLTSNAQPVWTEDFGFGCNQGQLATAYNGVNGQWTETLTGQNDPEANLFYISAAEAGQSIGSCGDACMNTPTLLNRTLHIGNVQYDLIITIAADHGASYNSGGTCVDFNICSTTFRRIESPTINCSGASNMTLSFKYMMGGDGANDMAAVLYSIDNGANFNILTFPAVTATCPGGQGKWTQFSMTLPSECNNVSQLKIAFNWQNNDDGIGSDPSFAVDDISIDPGDPTGVSEQSINSFSVFPNPVYDKTKIVFNAAVKGNYSIEFFNSVGQSVMKEKVENVAGNFSKTFDLSALESGIYFVQLNTPAGTETKKLIVH